MRRKTTLALICGMCLLLALSGYAFAATFSDVQGHWAGKQIIEWADEGLAAGYSDGTFKPNKEVSRAEFVALVNRAFSIDKNVASAGFSDVSEGKWYYKDISAAKAAGYIGGYTDGTFKPNQTITRQEVASILVRLLSLTPTTEGIEEFADANQMPEWARSSIGAVAKNALMRGMPDKTFQPLESITRAEAVVSLDRAMDFTPGQEPPVALNSAIEGKVTLDGKAVEKATVRIFNADSYEVVNETQTDKNGSYKVELDAGEYDITATTDSEVAYKSDVKVSEDKVTNADLALEKAAIISGILKDKYGKVVKNTTVVLTTNPTFVAKTNSNGEFTVSVLPNKTYTVRAYDPGKETAEPVTLTSSLDVKDAGSQTVDLPKASFSVKTSSGGGGSSGGGSSTVAVTGVSINPSNLSMRVGDSKTLTATVAPTNATNKNVTWSTENADVATVENGVVTAVYGGDTIITVTTADGNKTAKCMVSVAKIESVSEETVNDLIDDAVNAGSDTVTIPAPTNTDGVSVSKDSLTNAVSNNKTLEVQVATKADDQAPAATVSVKMTSASLSSVVNQADVTNVSVAAKAISEQTTKQILEADVPAGILLASGNDNESATIFDISIVATKDDGTDVKNEEVKQLDSEISITVPVPDSLKVAATEGILKVYRYDEVNKTWIELTSSYDGSENITFTTNHLCKFLMGFKLIKSIADQTVAAGSSQDITIHRLSHLIDFSAVSGTPAIADVSVTDNVITITGVQAGTAEITVTATFHNDTTTITTTIKFTVTVTSSSQQVVLDEIANQAVTVGSTVDVTATTTPTDATITAVSGDETKATVTVNGKTITISGVAEGTADITVTASKTGMTSATRTFTVTVNPTTQQPVVLEEIANTAVTVGSTVDVTATTTPTDATIAATSSDETKATVTVNGKTITIEGKAEGTATITVTASKSGMTSATRTFTVTVNPTTQQQVVLDEIANQAVTVGSTVDVTATTTPTDATITAVSGDETKTTVAVNGKTITISGVAEGTADITVTASKTGMTSATETFTVTVNAAAPTPEYTFQVLDSLVPGMKTVLVKLTDVDSTLYDVYVGDVQLTYQADKNRFLGDVLIANALETNLSIVKKQLLPVTIDTIANQTVTAGETVQVTATTTPTDATITAVSGDETKATVAVNGKTITISGVAEGTADITVTASKTGMTSATETFTVTVNAAAPTPEYTFQVLDSLVPGMKTVLVKLTDVDSTLYDVYVGDVQLTYQADKNRFLGDVLIANALETNLSIVKKQLLPVTIDTIANQTVTAGETVQVTATTTPTDATITAVSGDETKATVAVNGKTITISGVAEGTADITVTASKTGMTSATETFTVTVNAAAPTPEYTFQVLDSLVPGMKTVLVKLTDVDSTLYDVYVGDVQLTYQADKNRFLGDVLIANALETNLSIVKKQLLPVTIDTIANQTVTAGETVQVTATTTPTDATITAVSGDETKATVAVNGKTITISGVAEGTADITVTASKTGMTSATETFTVTVNAAAPTPEYTFQVLDSLVPGMKTVLVKLTDVDSTLYDVYVGDVQLTYQADKNRFLGDVLIANALETNLSIVKKQLLPVTIDTIANQTVTAGETVQVTATTTPTDATITAVSGDETKATVAVNGKTITISGVAEGTADITVTASKTGMTSATETFTVTVNAAAPTPEYTFQVLDSLVPGMKTVLVKLTDVDSTLYDVYVGDVQLTYQADKNRFLGDVLIANALETNLNITQK